MPPKRSIEGSGDVGAAEEPEHGVKMETEVAVDTSATYLYFFIVPCCFIINLGCFIIILYHILVLTY